MIIPLLSNTIPSFPISSRLFPLISHYYPTIIPLLSHYYPTIIPLLFHYYPITTVSHYYPIITVSHYYPTIIPLLQYPTIIPLLSHYYPIWSPLIFTNCHGIRTENPLLSHLLLAVPRQDRLSGSTPNDVLPVTSRDMKTEAIEIAMVIYSGLTMVYGR